MRPSNELASLPKAILKSEINIYSLTTSFDACNTQNDSFVINKSMQSMSLDA